jgi:hypothetical protein
MRHDQNSGIFNSAYLNARVRFDIQSAAICKRIGSAEIEVGCQFEIRLHRTEYKYLSSRQYSALNKDFQMDDVLRIIFVDPGVDI